MKRQLIFIIIIIFISIRANSQIDKHYWIVGGSGNYNVQYETSNGIKYRATTLTVSPDFGYFFFNKFCIGSNLGYTLNKTKNLTYNITQTTLNYFYVSPFVRYYLFKEDGRFNSFGQISYYYQATATSNPTKDNGVTFTLGGVCFLNNCVGFELMANYQSIKSNDNTNTKAQNFFIRIGFQIHLIKEKFVQ